MKIPGVGGMLSSCICRATRTEESFNTSTMHAILTLKTTWYTPELPSMGCKVHSLVLSFCFTVTALLQAPGFAGTALALGHLQVVDMR